MASQLVLDGTGKWYCDLFKLLFKELVKPIKWDLFCKRYPIMKTNAFSFEIKIPQSGLTFFIHRQNFICKLIHIYINRTRRVLCCFIHKHYRCVEQYLSNRSLNLINIKIFYILQVMQLVIVNKI